MRSPTISMKLQQIAEQAASNPQMVFHTLSHHMDIEFLHEAYARTRKTKSSGVDKVTAKEYAENLEANLGDLYQRMRSGKYTAPPVKRVWIEKEDKSQRPIGIPAFEDKIVQRAVSMLLGAVFNQDFHDFSYGFIEGRSPHQALRAIWEQSTYKMNNINWILDADVSGFFDNINHKLLREIIKERVNDGGLLRYIGKWLNAGVQEGTVLSYSETGTPQGGVISPLLANIFLHHVLDEWFVKEVKTRMKGQCFLVRFADDFVIGFEEEEDARRVMTVLTKRFARFDLSIHPKKTKLIRFGRPDTSSTDDQNETFDFLGFTFYWGKTRKGSWVIKKKTCKKRFKRTMKSLWAWCKDNRHEPVTEQFKTLCSKLRGHYQYYGVRGNYRLLELIFEHVERAWRFWLGRRSRTSYVTWEKFEQLRSVFRFPSPRIVHDI